MNKFPYCHVFDGQVVRAAAPGIRETCDRILFASLYNQKYFPLHGEDKFPLWEGYIFESKIPLVVRIGLAARACGSGIGPSPSNSVATARIYITQCVNTDHSRYGGMIVEILTTPGRVGWSCKYWPLPVGWDDFKTKAGLYSTVCTVHNNRVSFN